jgi:hypothetical protein
MNGDENCGAVRFLERGVVDEAFCENGEVVTTSQKILPLKQPLVDVAVVGRRRRCNNENDTTGEATVVLDNVAPGWDSRYCKSTTVGQCH